MGLLTAAPLGSRPLVIIHWNLVRVLCSAAFAPVASAWWRHRLDVTSSGLPRRLQEPAPWRTTPAAGEVGGSTSCKEVGHQRLYRDHHKVASPTTTPVSPRDVSRTQSCGTLEACLSPGAWAVTGVWKKRNGRHLLAMAGCWWDVIPLSISRIGAGTRPPHPHPLPPGRREGEAPETQGQEKKSCVQVPLIEFFIFHFFSHWNVGPTLMLPISQVEKHSNMF